MSSIVTWLIPVKNGMPFLPFTLASIEAQTFKGFKVLAWNDGSTDSSLLELERWIPGRIPGRVLSGHSIGVGAALNKLVALADTELCARIDADDVCRPDRLQKQVKFLEDHPEIALVGSNLRLIDEKGCPTGVFFDYPSDHESITHALLASNPIGHPSVLFRRRCVLGVGNYDSNAKLEDYDLWLRMASQYKLANIAEYLVDYRIHPNSAMRILEKEKKVKLLNEQTLEKHVTSLFGLSPAELQRLREKGDTLAVARAWKMARHLSRAQASGALQRLRNPDLVKYFSSSTRRRDCISRLSFAFLAREPGSLRRELRGIARDLWATFA